MEWLYTRQVAPLITELRLHTQALAQTEMGQALQHLPGINPIKQEIITQMAYHIFKKLLHNPTVNLKSRTMQNYRYDYAHTIRQLFALDQWNGTEHVTNE